MPSYGLTVLVNDTKRNHCAFGMFEEHFAYSSPKIVCDDLGIVVKKNNDVASAVIAAKVPASRYSEIAAGRNYLIVARGLWCR